LAKSPKAFSVSFTAIKQILLKERFPELFLNHFSFTTIVFTPFLITCSTKSCPSNFSPLIAKNRSFLPHFLESIETPEKFPLNAFSGFNI